jgi:hypothetical protein
MNGTLGYIILPMLYQLKKDKQGAPLVEDEDAPEELKRMSAPEVSEYETDDNWFKRWDYVMNEMIFAFESINSDWEDQFHSGEHDVYFEKMEGTNYSEMKKGPNDTHKFDYEGYKKYSDRMENGFRLFGKYYMGLWD